MELTKDNYAEFVSQLSHDQKLNFYEPLAHNLTVVCRMIWSDEESTKEKIIESMKWLNEIQHRITSKINVERTKHHEWKESDIIGMIEEYTKQSPSIGPDVAWAIKSSYNTIIEKNS